MLRALSDIPIHTHHPQLYFPDGDIVVRCRNRDREDSFTYFCVHRAVLEKSELLRNVLAIPHPDDTQMYYDNLPMINSVDDPRDVAVVLKYSYDPSQSPVHEEDVDVAYRLYGVLEMADKFLLEDLKSMILEHIQRDWPTTLEAWDERERLFYTRWESQPHKAMDFHAPEPASVIRVARRFNLRSILPIAFYHLSRTAVDTAYPNHSKEVLKLADYSARSARVELLGVEDRFKALAGRERMFGWIGMQIENLGIEERWGSQCPLVSSATEGGDEDGGGEVKRHCYDNVVLRLLTIQTNILANWDPLKTLKSNFGALEEEGAGSNGGAGASRVGSDSLCARCRKEWDEWVGATRQRLFDSLTDFFLDL
ncbi:hypothetical protein CC1G_12509 [Coprinopsis cinerea okayama7|uniref:BTB domain-containing protein n=1 Tax=Coprinopsis cinerea (strain Okayama-7 / 130 / ATCC MYA-4618 / FGSC 9003) TaxID=240176 RepID=A8PAF9_COPC7|nr:hypothetical protein CC1G_12509 [Coprinopsis cinerea okayama7\|eukprot:XP_001839980.1 hypothetical protein CC1G_12509 [Coprinopsis cinerea okayama7\